MAGRQKLNFGAGCRTGTTSEPDYSEQFSSVLSLDSMSHCVPDWDCHVGELDAIVATTDHLPPVKEKWMSVLHKRSPLSDLPLVQGPDAVPSEWTDSGQVVSQSDGSDSKHTQWQANCTNWSGVQGSEDAVTPSKPVNSSSCKDSSLAVNVSVVDTSMNADSMQEDEMVTWLQYPLDDSLEKNYCSPFFGELPNTDRSGMQAIRDSFTTGQTAAGRSSRNLPPVNSGNNGSLNRVANADAAMAMGAGRAAGVLPQTGVEAFTKVRTTMQQPHAGKWSANGNPNQGKALGNASTSHSPGPRTPSVEHILSSPMLPPKSQPIKGYRNFSHFSRPVVNIKASLQCLGMSHVGTGTNRPKSPFSANRPFDATTSSGSSIAESTTTMQQSGASRNDTDVHAEGPEGQPPSLATESSWPSMQKLMVSKGAETAVHSAGVHVGSGSGPAEFGNCRSPIAKTNADTSTDKYVSVGADLPDPPEPTLTSSSGGSGNSADRGKGLPPRGKRRVREPEESECQSDDAEDEVIELKKTQRGSTAKRTRQAAVHNLSERRRRDRINEKMKALQELIPNSNKADKASMLDEAIEYLKMLQIQLQMMSMRSGMSIPALIPTGLQHLQIPQMGAMPPMGIGMGMGMGMGPMVGMGAMPPMGMGMLEMNSMAAGRPSHLVSHLSHGGQSHSGSHMMAHQSHGGASYNVSQVMPHPSHGGPSHTVSATSPAVSMVDPNDFRLQSNSALESVYLARQHPLQLTPQTMDVYNAYMIHQHQQQQQQQQQQQHHLHHLSNNMGSGGP